MVGGNGNGQGNGNGNGNGLQVPRSWKLGAGSLGLGQIATFGGLAIREADPLLWALAVIGWLLTTFAAAAVAVISAFLTERFVPIGRCQAIAAAAAKREAELEADNETLRTLVVRLSQTNELAVSAHLITANLPREGGTQ